MHLLFDGQALQTASRGRGVGRYTANLLQALRQARPDWRIVVIEAQHLPPLDRERLPTGLEYERLKLPVLPLPNRLNRWFNDRAYGDWLADHPADAYLSAHSFEKEGVHPLFGMRRLPQFVILYDLIPQRFEEIYLTDLAFRDFYADRLQQTVEADVLLAISDWSARDYRELQAAGPARVVAIGGAPDPHLQPLPPERLLEVETAMRAKFNLKREFILNPSGQCWRKNSRGALTAFGQLPLELKGGYDFVVACKINRAEEEDLWRIADEHGIRDSLRLTGYVSDEELQALYQRCRVCVFPSFYEGIGLPIVEALQCGAPVVTNDCSSLPEFAGPHSFLADPLDSGSLTRALELALLEPRDTYAEERIAFAKSFSWESIGERAAQAIESELATRRRITSHRRPRLAWATSASLRTSEMERVETIVEELLARFSVEVVLPNDHPGLRPSFNCIVPQLRENEVRERHRLSPFDYFVYDGFTGCDQAFLARLADKYPGLLLDSSDAIPHPVQRIRHPRASSGFVARAVLSHQRWAELKPLTMEPLYLLEGDPGPTSSKMLTATRLAEALESLGRSTALFVSAAD